MADPSLSDQVEGLAEESGILHRAISPLLIFAVTAIWVLYIAAFVVIGGMGLLIAGAKGLSDLLTAGKQSANPTDPSATEALGNIIDGLPLLIIFTFAVWGYVRYWPVLKFHATDFALRALPGRVAAARSVAVTGSSVLGIGVVVAGFFGLQDLSDAGSAGATMLGGTSTLALAAGWSLRASRRR